MKKTESPLHNSFEVELLKRYLIEHPQESIRLAITHFEDYLEVVHEYKKLEQKYKSNSIPPITQGYFILKSVKICSSPNLHFRSA